MDNKIKTYLGTSVISHLQATDTPEKMIDTLLLWEDVNDKTIEGSKNHS
jgi:hypothetical protein